MIPPVDGLSDKSHLGQVQPVLDRMSSLVEGMARYATHVITFTNHSGNDDLDIPPVLLLRHAAAQGMGLATLVRSGSTEAADPVLRTMLESCLGLDFMLQRDRRRRAAAYRVGALKKHLALAESLDPNSDRGKLLRAKLARDVFSPGYSPNITIERIDEVRTRVQRSLDSSVLREAAQEWDRLRSLSKRPPAWYSLFDGPKNLEDLARSVGAEGIYEVLYRSYSKVAHSEAATDGVSYFDDELIFKHLFDPVGVEKHVTMGVNFLLHSSNRVARTFATPEQWAQLEYYYAAHVRDAHLSLAGTKVLRRA